MQLVSTSSHLVRPGMGGLPPGVNSLYGGAQSVTNGHFRDQQHTVNNYVVTVKGTPPEPPNFNLPTAQTGIMVPYFIGQQRIFSPNVLWYGNLQNIYETTTELISQETTTTGNVPPEHWLPVDVTHDIVTTYEETTSLVGFYVSMAMGLALGPGAQLLEVYEDNSLIWSGTAGPGETTITPNNSEFLLDDLVFYGGNNDQAQSSLLAGWIASNVSSMPGVSYVIAKRFRGDHGFGKLSFELARKPDPLAFGANNIIGADINPITAIYDVITNPWGGAGISASRINTSNFAALAAKLKAEGNGCSVYNQRETSPLQILSTLLSQANCIMYHNPETGLLSFDLIRPADYDLNALQVVTQHNANAIRELKKSTWKQSPDQIRSTFTDRAGDYSSGVVVQQNPARLTSGGRSKSSLPLDFPTVMTAELAQKLTSRELAQAGAPSMTFDIVGSRDFSASLPGQGLLVDWPDYQMNNFPVIVTRRKELGAQENQVILSVSQMFVGKEAQLFAEPDENQWTPISLEPVTPAAATLINAPYWLAAKAGLKRPPYVDNDRALPIMLVESGNASQRSYSYYIDNLPEANGNRVRVGVGSYASVGELSSALSRFAGFNTGEVASVTIENVDRPDNMLSVEESGVKLGRVLAFIGNEIVSFEGATNNGNGEWTLTNVHRGLLDTVAEDHAAGAKIYIVTNTWDWIARTTHYTPETYNPEWLFVSNTVTKADSVDDGLSYDGWDSNDRLNRPLRPHDTRIGSSRTEAPINVTRDEDYTINWKTRSRMNVSDIKLQTEAAEAAEPQDAANTYMVHRVMIRDSADTEWDLGATADSADNINSKSITVPAGAATGNGVLWVQSETVNAVSMFHDELPINIV